MDMKNTEATHKGRPESSNWFTTGKRGSWRVGCTDCDHLLVLVYRFRKDGTVTDHWRHIR